MKSSVVIYITDRVGDDCDKSGLREAMLTALIRSNFALAVLYSDNLGTIVEQYVSGNDRCGCL